MLGHVVTKTNRERHQAVIQPCRVDTTLWGILSLLLFYYHLRRQVYVKVLTKHHSPTGTGLFYKAAGTNRRVPERPLIISFMLFWGSLIHGEDFLGLSKGISTNLVKTPKQRIRKDLIFPHTGTAELFLVVGEAVDMIFNAVGFQSTKGSDSCRPLLWKTARPVHVGWLIGAAHLNVKACQPPWTGINDKRCIFQGAGAYSCWHNTGL